MDANGLSVLRHLRSKPVGKLRQRVQSLRTHSSFDPLASEPTLDLSHNESVRLAADSLLNRGLVGYQEVLTAEGEVDFLSEQEKSYILMHGRDANIADTGSEDEQLAGCSADSLSLTRRPAVSTDSDPSVLGLDLGSLSGFKFNNPVLGPPSAEVYFQSDHKAAYIKDLVREFIRKASTALAIVVNTFSDVELLCDLLEASRKRSVSVHLLLDHLNLDLFFSMYQDLNINSKYFPRLSVRSVDGQTYCAKTGRKLTGQITESFIITDWTEVLTGSYSFTWLSWQVHRSVAVLLKGGSVTPFNQEFRRLYASSKPVPNLLTAPHQLPLKDPSGIRSTAPSQTRTIGNWTLTKEGKSVEAQSTLREVKMQADAGPSVPGLSKPQATETECSRTDIDASTQPLHKRGIVHSAQTSSVYQTQTHLKPLVQTQIQTQTHPKSLAQIQVPVGSCGISSITKEQCVFAENPGHTVCGLSNLQTQTNLEPLVQNQTRNQTQTQPKPLVQAQNQMQSHPKYLGESRAPYDPLTVVPLPENNTQDTHSQSKSKTHSNADVPAHATVGIVGRFLQVRSKNSGLTMGSGIAVGLNKPTGQQNDSLTMSPKADPLSTDSQLPSSSVSQQTQAKTDPTCPYTQPRSHTLWPKTQSSALERQTQPQTHFQSHLQSKPESPDSNSASPVMGTNFRSQLQPQLDSKLSLPHVGTKLQPQTQTSQPFSLPPRVQLISQWHVARTRPVLRQKSFSSAYETGYRTGGQLDWRPFQNNVTTSFGRTNGQLGRHTATVQGSLLSPKNSKK